MPHSIVGACLLLVLASASSLPRKIFTSQSQSQINLNLKSIPPQFFSKISIFEFQECDLVVVSLNTIVNRKFHETDPTRFKYDTKSCKNNGPTEAFSYFWGHWSWIDSIFLPFTRWFTLSEWNNQVPLRGWGCPVVFLLFKRLKVVSCIF